eukprot:Partr_v1_DN27442_c4_g1_i6_m71846 putative Rna-binding protein
MDFRNKCNVGYAFINFPNPVDAVTFASRVCGKKWKKFNSEKVCTMSYASIQGVEALISKFRDSQVSVAQNFLTLTDKKFHFLHQQNCDRLTLAGVLVKPWKVRQRSMLI